MGELIVPVAILMVSIFFFADSGMLPAQDPGFPMSSSTYPQFLSGLMILLCAYLIIRFFIKHKEYIAADKARYFDLRVLAVFGMFVVFYWVIPFLGYILSAFVFLVVLSLFFQKGKPRKMDTFILPACLSVGMFFAFNFMSIYLPTGTLFRGLF